MNFGGENEIEEKVTEFIKYVKRKKQSSWEDYVKIFEIAEKNGFHILETGFYNPIPVVGDISDDVFSEEEDQSIDWNGENQILLLKKLKKYVPEFHDIVNDRKFDISNSYFGWHDAPIYYTMIRFFQPKQIIEIGGGFSTKIAYLASQKNHSTAIKVIDPFLSEDIKNNFSEFVKLIENPVQNVPIDFFKDLNQNDILFIDSTHVSKIGSDVNFLFLKILPILKPGVIIHIHDIFLPNSYPKEWIKNKLIFWNEQFLLHAFLIGNKDFEILISNAFLRKHNHDDLKDFYDSDIIGGASFWMRKL